MTEGCILRKETIPVVMLCHVVECCEKVDESNRDVSNVRFVHVTIQKRKNKNPRRGGDKEQQEHPTIATNHAERKYFVWLFQASLIDEHFFLKKKVLTYPGWTASLPVSLMASKTLGTFMYDWLDAPGPTQIDSSAAETNRALESAVEKMATDWIPMSLQVRATRSEISPRFAIKTLLNGFLLLPSAVVVVVVVEKYDDDVESTNRVRDEYGPNRKALRRRAEPAAAALTKT